MAIALSNQPRARTTAAIRPHTISEKYSAGPDCSATAARGGAASAITSVETQPAKNEPSAALQRDRAAGTCGATAGPSSGVATADGYAGILHRSGTDHAP